MTSHAPSLRAHGSSAGGRLWSLAWPAMVHMQLTTLVFAADRAIVGRYDAGALASLGLSTTVSWTACSLLGALSLAALPLVGRALGAGDRHGAIAAARAAIGLAALLGALATLGLMLGRVAIVRGLFPATEPALEAQALAYLEIVLPALPCALVATVASGCLQAAGDTRTPLLAAAAGHVVNLALGMALVFGRAGLPELGVRGAAIGAAAAFAIEAVVLLAALCARHSPLPLLTPSPARGGGLGRGSPLRQLFTLAAPAFGERCAFHAAYLGYVALIAVLGARAMACHQALLGIEAVACLSADGIGVAAGALVAERLGAAQPAQADNAVRQALRLAVGLLCGCGVVFVLARAQLLAAFATDREVLALGVPPLVLAALAQPFMAFATVAAASLRGAGDMKTPLVATLLGTVVLRLGASYVFALPLGLGLSGIWLGSLVDWVARALFLGAVLLRRRW